MVSVNSAGGRSQVEIERIVRVHWLPTFVFQVFESWLPLPMFSQLFKDRGLFQHSQISTKFNFPLAAPTFSTFWLKLKFSQLSWCSCGCVCVCSSGVEEGCCQSNRLNRFRDSNQKKRHKSPRRSCFSGKIRLNSRCHSTGGLLLGKCRRVFRAAAVERPLEMLRFMGRPQH
uniref:(northern house mosquito) hypothetical protein n=1 Tax=Culex pipiens TaxID=7175 RepID=A0A8D7ZZZ8_CULPI